ncbi:hypothetical protein [Candidatus Phytoplasma luffae]|uniref:hypothetical protein n=1 Tax=Loofah witches'-broom phytoplasma TaxID=35773 RepID=UPI001B36346B|nr:hypothetical protein [Candidatus Phytoplasma luffae]
MDQLEKTLDEVRKQLNNRFATMFENFDKLDKNIAELDKTSNKAEDKIDENQK